MSCESSATYSYSRHLDVGTRLEDNTHTVLMYISYAADPPSRVQRDCFAAFELFLEIPDLNDRYKLVRSGNRERLEWNFDYKVTVSGSSLQMVLVTDGEEHEFQKFNLNVFENI